MAYPALTRPMSLFPLKPTHAPVKAYYAASRSSTSTTHKTEGNTRPAFEYSDPKLSR